MRRDEQRRRNAWALGLSLVLHALIALVLWRQEANAPVARPSHEAIELSIVEVTPPPPPPEEQPKPVEAPPPPPTAKKKDDKAASSAPASATAAAQPESAQPQQTGGTPTTGPVANAAPDSPKSFTLVPRSDFVVQNGLGPEPEGPRGHTIVNSPDERPDPVAMKEYTSEKLGRRTNAMVEGMVASAKAKTGLVHPYFMGARSAMETDLSNSRVPGDKKLLEAGVKGYLDAQERFGKTGNPLGANDRFAEDTQNQALNRMQNSGAALAASDSNAAGAMRQAEQQMASTHAALAAMDNALLVAVLEIYQEPGGGVGETHIVKSSGSKAFDEHVLHRARKVFLKLDDPPEAGQGISSAGWRTLWRFSYFGASAAEMRGQRVRVELIKVVPGGGSGNPLEHVDDFE